MASLGSVEWLCLEFEADGWPMIACENLIAAAHGTGTKLCAAVSTAESAQGVAHALQLGQ